MTVFAFATKPSFFFAAVDEADLAPEEDPEPAGIMLVCDQDELLMPGVKALVEVCATAHETPIGHMDVLMERCAAALKLWEKE